MGRISGPHWILHSHIMEDDAYECSECGGTFGTESPVCPDCGAPMAEWMTEDDQGWVEEAAVLDLFLGDD